MSFNLGFIGGGNMSTAIAKGILSKDAHPASKIWVSGPRLENLKPWIEMGANVTTSNGEVVNTCDIVFLGVKPGMLHQAVADCLSSHSSTSITKGVLFVSMLAGISIKDLQKELYLLTRNPSVVRIMPNTPMMVGSGVCLYTPDSTVTPAQCEILEKLINSCGVSERVAEPMMDSLGVLTGCGPAFMYVIMEALSDGAVKQGATRVSALRLAAHTVAGAAHMVLRAGKHPALLKDDVCSPAGSTICGIAALEAAGVRAAMINAIEAAANRTKEIGKK